MNAVNTSGYIHRLLSLTYPLECVYVGNLNRWKKEVAGPVEEVESRLSGRQRRGQEGRRTSVGA